MDIYLFTQLWLTFLTPGELKTSLVHSEKILQKFYSITRSMPFQMFRKFCWCKVKRSHRTKLNSLKQLSGKNRPHLTQALQINLKKRSVFLCPTSGELLPSELQNHSKTMHIAQHWSFILHKRLSKKFQNHSSGCMA